mmetsp:Transcript_26860/g.30742  ORF Transcript_26860/g.30742 Transcript_26860/m.30742 type:complete len:407 (-) Transcript_26860:79-1299(-)
MIMKMKVYEESCNVSKDLNGSSATGTLNLNVDVGVFDDDDVDSVDEALMEMLGISSFQTNANEDDEEEVQRETSLSSATDEDTKIFLQTQNVNHTNIPSNNDNGNMNMFPSLNQQQMIDVANTYNLKDIYDREGICILPPEFNIQSKAMRRLTDELIYGSSKYQSDRTHETIQFIKNGIIGQRRELTRFENFVTNHSGWKDLCYNYITKCISAIMGQEMVLFKEKLNLKPPGGSGFAPHLDTPSLRVALGDNGPQTFVTIMIAIDDMTTSNGYLKVSKGPWTEHDHCEIVMPSPTEINSNPDAEGRRGAIESEVANNQIYEDIIIKGGTIAAFNGWMPHRSLGNTSPFPRRAVFLTYNPLHEGDFRELYYQKMKTLRNDFRDRSLQQQNYEIDEMELAALASIPRI